MKESEAQFQKWIVDTAEGFGWRVWHVPTPMRPIGNNRFVPDPRGRGLLDLLMLHDKAARMILAEVKREDGKTSVEQDEMIRLTRKVVARLRVDNDGMTPLQVFMWRPHHRDLIEATLRV